MRRTVSLALLVLVLAGCASRGPSVHVRADPAAALASYQTYGFVAEPGTNRAGYSTFVTGYFKQAVRREMDARGYRYDEANPDLLVNFSANAREVTEVRSTPNFGGPPFGYYGYRGGLYRWGPWYGQDVDTIRYRVGTANVDVVDARRKEMIWEGVAEGTLSSKAMRDPKQAIDAAVRAMFEKFPAKAGGGVNR
jgi:hypothetical protein